MTEPRFWIEGPDGRGWYTVGRGRREIVAKCPNDGNAKLIARLLEEDLDRIMAART